jgi:cell division protein FtsB
MPDMDIPDHEASPPIRWIYKRLDEMAAAITLLQTDLRRLDNQKQQIVDARQQRAVQGEVVYQQAVENLTQSNANKDLEIKALRARLGIVEVERDHLERLRAVLFLIADDSAHADQYVRWAQEALERPHER